MSTGRKPAHIVAAAPKPQGRDVIWAKVRAFGLFTLRDLRDATDIPERTIATYLTGLVAAGYLTSDLVDGRREWCLVRDTGIEAPRVRADGSEVMQGRGTENLWRTMKILGQFTVAELAATAATDEVAISLSTARSYVQALARAGYLAALPRPEQNAHARYRFARDTGPKPPQIQRVKLIFDPNTQEQIALDGGEVAS